MPREPTAATPGPAPDANELATAPPFLSWPALYLIVIAALVVELAGFVALTLCYR